MAKALYTATAWLKKDAVNRMVRTFWQAVGFTMATSVGDVVVQAMERVVDSELHGRPIDWAEVGSWTWHGAVAAALLPLIAYWHRRKLDPSSVPSAPPPVPPRA